MDVRFPPPAVPPRPAGPSAPIARRAPAGPEPAAPAPAAPGAAPGLWDLLTAEEREFFAARAALGPLVYGPARGGAAPAAAPLGGRVDVRG